MGKKRIELKQLVANLRKNLGLLDSIKIISRDFILRFNKHFSDINKCIK